jgi:hypothetical protein
MAAAAFVARPFCNSSEVSRPCRPSRLMVVLRGRAFGATHRVMVSEWDGVVERRVDLVVLVGAVIALALWLLAADLR